jgi:hypothetical protein
VYHLKGACQYGSDCAFAHSCTELQSTPDLRKTRLCQAFDAGGCDNPDCSFAHGEEELRSTNLFFKKTLCIWNQKGKCRNGEQCRFAHGAAELHTTPGVPPAAPSSKATDGAGATSKATATESRRGARQATRTTSDPKKLSSEPMKVLPTVPLVSPAELEPMQVPTPQYIPKEFKPMPSAMQGMPYVGEAQLPGLFPEAQWWPWQGGMAPSPLVAGTEEELKAEMQADLERLRENVTNLTRQCSEIQWHIMTAQPSSGAAQLIEDVLQQLQYRPTATEQSSLKARRAGRAAPTCGMDNFGMGQGIEAPWSTYWGA